MCDKRSLSSNYSRGGGVLIAIRKDDADNLNIYFLKFYVENIYFMMCSIYIPLSMHIPLYEYFVSVVQYTINNNSDSLFIFSGDFNFPDIS